MKFTDLFRFCPVCGSPEFNQNNGKSKRCDACGFVMYVNPASAVGVFLLNNAGELLVCERAKEPCKGTLDLPGGFVDEYETAEQAVIRELEEELGILVTGAEYRFSLPNEYTYSGWTLPTLDMFYVVRLPGGAVPVPADDVSACYFLSPDKIDAGLFGLSSMKLAVSRFLLNPNHFNQ